jgi:hypothetical protein
MNHSSDRPPASKEHDAPNPQLRPHGWSWGLLYLLLRLLKDVERLKCGGNGEGQPARLNRSPRPLFGCNSDF